MELQRERSLSAPSGAADCLLVCCHEQRHALSAALALHYAVLTQNTEAFLLVASHHVPQCSDPALATSISHWIATLRFDPEHNATRLSHLHAALDFETPDGIMLSHPVSKTVMLSLELAMIFAMGQVNRLQDWLSAQRITAEQDSQQALNDNASRLTFGHLGPTAPDLARRAYEINKVLQHYWAGDQPKYSVERDGLLVRYTADPKPVCLARSDIIRHTGDEIGTAAHC